jgi:plastocyanin
MHVDAGDALWCPSQYSNPEIPRMHIARSTRRWSTSAFAAALVAACQPQRAPAKYHPRTRALTVTTVPLLVKEQESLYPFLHAAFAKGGTLDGKEVYAFSPSTLTVVEGDTLHLTLINPEDDAHSFVLPDLAVSLAGNTTTQATYVARRAGIFPIMCAVEAHLPMMTGQLVVLPASAMADSTR